MPDPHFHPVIKNGLTVSEIALLCGVALNENPQKYITGAATLKNATPQDLTYCAQKAFVEDLKQTRAGLCLVKTAFANDVPAGTIALVTEDPALVYAKVTRALYPEMFDAEIHSLSVIAPTAKIGQNTAIGAFTVIGEHVQIGENCKIYNNCSISHAVIGNNTVIYPGARIGQDGFGFVFDKSAGRHIKIPQLGRVTIGDYVEIGANVTIDRGAMDDTVIGDGCIIDNLVQVGHNVKLGRGVILVSQSGIAGSSTLGNYAVVAAQGGVADHVHIGDGAQIGAQAGIMRDVAANERVLGSPALPIRQFMRQMTTLEKLSERKKSDV